MDHVGGLLGNGLKRQLRPDVPIHVAAAEVEFWKSPDFSRNTFAGMPHVLRSAAKRFLDEYGSQLRTFENEVEVAPGLVVRRTGGHTPAHSVVRLADVGDDNVGHGCGIDAGGREALGQQPRGLREETPLGVAIPDGAASRRPALCRR